MSKQAPALPLVKVIDAKVSDQEKLLMVLVEAASGQRFWLTWPTSEAPQLARAAGLGFSAERDDQLRNHALIALNASWAEFLTIPEEPEALALSITFGSGAVLTFRLPKPMPQTMLEILQVALRQESPKLPVNNAQSLAEDRTPRGSLTSHRYEQ